MLSVTNDLEGIDEQTHLKIKKGSSVVKHLCESRSHISAIASSFIFSASCNILAKNKEKSM